MGDLFFQILRPSHNIWTLLYLGASLKSVGNFSPISTPPSLIPIVFYSYLLANFDSFLPLPPSQLLTSFRNGSFWWNIYSWKHSSTKLRMLFQKEFHPIVLSFDLRGTPWHFSFNIHHHLSFFVTALLGIDLQKKRV